MIGAAVAVVLFIVLAISRTPTPRQDDADAIAAAAATDAALAAADAASDAAQAASEAAGVLSSAGSGTWRYSTDEDKVRGAATYYAQTSSTNSVFQASPYDSATTMDIIVRKSPAHGTDVMLQISSGQMMCPSYRGCSGTVRFDDGKPQTVAFNGPSDNGNETVFVIGSKGFIAKLKQAKRVVIEKTLYNAGNPQFEFDVSGLNWDH